MDTKRGKYGKKASYPERESKQRRPKRGLLAGKRISFTFKSEAKQKDIEESQRKPTTGWRLWLFRIVALTVIPTLLFFLLELFLRIVGYGFPANSFVECQAGGKDVYVSNAKFSRRFFPLNIARSSYPFVFPKEKSENTYRVFVLGESAAAGVPAEAFCFGRILEVMLRHQYPQEKFEVITTAMAAINSHVILPIAKDCARHDADLFVAYMGNNEVIGPYGAGTVFAPLSGSLSFIRFDIAFKATKVGQMITSLVGSLSQSKGIPKVWRGLAMFMENQIRADDPRLETVYQHFQKNLEDIEQVARRNNIGIIFCTVGSSLKDCPPFASLHRPNLTESEKTKWEDIYQQAVAYETAGKYTQAIEHYLAAAQIDDCYADLQFRLGRRYEMIDNYDRSREYYIQARELDTLRFRADNRINEIIRAVAGNKTAEGVCLVDAVKVFEEHSSHKTMGHNLFYEHVHLNFEGNYLLAKTVFEQVEKILPERIKRQRANTCPMLTMTECARDLAYTDWDKYVIAYMTLNSYIKTPPFTNQLYHEERVEQMEQKLKALKDNLTPKVLEEADIRYRSAIENNKDDWCLHKKYGEFLNRGMKDYRAAVEQHYIALEYIDHYWIHGGLGELLGKLGNFDAAIEHNLKAIQMNPSYTKVHYNLAESYQKKGQIDEAIEHYYKMLHSHPDYVMAYHNLGMLLCQQDKVDEAVKLYRQGLPFAPDSALMHHNYGCLLAIQGHKQEAIEELRVALQIDPNSMQIREVLEKLLNESDENKR